jgi:hypothetical protein
VTLPRFSFTGRARPFLELGVGDSRVPGNAARWDVQRWDQPDALWSGVEPTWQDVTCQGYEVRYSLGRERTTDRFDVGTMSVTATNVSGWADLEPPEPGDISTLQLRPGRAIRFGVDHVEHGRVILWRGFVDTVDPVYEPGSSVVRLQCIDALGEVGRTHLAAADPSGDGETVTARIGRTLDAVQWPDSKRRLDGSSTLLLGAKLDGQAADLLTRAADSNGGAVYGDVDAAVVYRAMNWQTFPTGRPVDATIGNVAAGDVCPVRWVRPFARADITTRVILQNRREPEPDIVQVDDSAWWSLYGIETFERTDLDTAAVAVLTDMAHQYLRQRGPDTAPRVRSVSLDAATGDAVVDLLTLASCYLPRRYRCRLLLDRLVFDDEHYCTGIAQVVTPDGWTADLNLDLAATYEATSAPRWEPAAGADAGMARWDRAEWG